MPLFQFAFNSGLLGFTPRNIFNFFRIEILPSHENGRCALFTPELSFELFRKWLLQFQFAFNWVLFPASFSSTLKFQPGFSFCSETGLWRYGSDAVWKKSRLCFFYLPLFLCFFHNMACSLFWSLLVVGSNAICHICIYVCICQTIHAFLFFSYNLTYFVLTYLVPLMVMGGCFFHMSRYHFE